MAVKLGKIYKRAGKTYKSTFLVPIKNYQFRDEHYVKFMFLKDSSESFMLTEIFERYWSLAKDDN